MDALVAPSSAAQPSSTRKLEKDDIILAEDGACSLRIGVGGGGTDNAVASALTLVTGGRTETLWSAA
jgi:hypothetical protein